MPRFDMATVGVSDSVSPSGEEAALFSAEKLLEGWRETCQSFLNWERQHIIVGEPDPEVKENHRRTLAWLLRMSRVLDSLVSDPEFPDASAAQTLKPLLFLLDVSWKVNYNPLPEETYQKILRQCFPENEPGSAGAR